MIITMIIIIIIIICSQRLQDATVMTMGFETLPHNDAAALMNHLATKGDKFVTNYRRLSHIVITYFDTNCDSDCHTLSSHIVTQVPFLPPWPPLTGAPVSRFEFYLFSICCGFE